MGAQFPVGLWSSLGPPRAGVDALCVAFVRSILLASWSKRVSRQAVGTSPGPGRSLHISSGAEKLLFSQSTGPCVYFLWYPLSPDITDTPQGSHSKDPCGAH